MREDKEIYVSRKSFSQIIDISNFSTKTVKFEEILNFICINATFASFLFQTTLDASFIELRYGKGIMPLVIRIVSLNRVFSAVGKKAPKHGAGWRYFAVF